MSELSVLTEPGASVVTILQDHGPNDGGWGPANVVMNGERMGPVLYTRTDEGMVEGLKRLATVLAKQTRKETKLVQYSQPEVLLSVSP